jgi:nucleotide-binding universal stress UspA family protein
MQLFPTRVLVAVDAGSTARTALAAARSLCAETGSELWLVHVKLLNASVAGKPVNPAQYEKLEREGEEVLDGLREELDGDGGVPVAQAMVRLGTSIPRSVAGFAEEIEAGLIVVGGTTRGAIERRVGGDAAVGLVRNAPCSVMVVPPHLEAQEQPIAQTKP